MRAGAEHTHTRLEGNTCANANDVTRQGVTWHERKGRRTGLFSGEAALLGAGRDGAERGLDENLTGFEGRNFDSTELHRTNTREENRAASHGLKCRPPTRARMRCRAAWTVNGSARVGRGRCSRTLEHSSDLMVWRPGVGSWSVDCCA
ncbi:MAG: hypothetical protein HC933_01610 [Pleurocapsa sp. SU_196_0]|nr:hypothetical protein [Pleurocapsa sp. SU_196_0]